MWSLFIYLSVQKAVNHLTVEQTKHKLEATVKIDPKVKVHFLGPMGKDKCAYDITYGCDITNTSASAVTVKIVSLEWFIGRLENSSTQSFRANLPGTGGPLRWQSLGIEVHYEKGFDAQILASLLRKNSNASREVVSLPDSQGGVGVYNPEDTFNLFQTIHVAETPDQWVGFILLMGVVTGDGLEQYYDYRHVHLAAASRSTEETEKIREGQ